MAADRRRDIAEAARAVLATDGPEGLTVGRIAGRLGIKALSLYKHVAGDDPHDLAAAYRAFALEQPALYRLMTERPLPRALLPAGLEARAAAPVLRAFGGQDLARRVGHRPRPHRIGACRALP